jgi:D-glycero-D-manno-heptose 1,7-bisphosphate phosphatase
MVRAVFLDRDGTLNVCPPPHEYVESAAGFQWLPDALDGLVSLAEQGFARVVVSNQRGVARGLVSRLVLAQIEGIIQSALARRGQQRVVAFRYCPHDHADACLCRKPAPGLIVEAAREFRIDLATSWMIGDSESDVLAGAAAGCRTARIAAAGAETAATLVAPSLLAVARSIRSADQRAGSA